MWASSPLPAGGEVHEAVVVDLHIKVVIFQLWLVYGDFPLIVGISYKYVHIMVYGICWYSYGWLHIIYKIIIHYQFLADFNGILVDLTVVHGVLTNKNGDMNGCCSLW